MNLCTFGLVYLGKKYVDFVFCARNKSFVHTYVEREEFNYSLVGNKYKLSLSADGNKWWFFFYLEVILNFVSFSFLSNKWLHSTYICMRIISAGVIIYLIILKSWLKMICNLYILILVISAKELLYILTYVLSNKEFYQAILIVV